MRSTVVLFILLFTSSIVVAQPRTFVLDPSTLTAIAASLRSGESEYKDAVKRLLRDADKALNISPVSVTQKEMDPPSGDKHDYMSMAGYWWPDPAKTDGLPYIRKDGVVNPEAAKFTDHENMSVMVRSVSTLALGYYYSGKSDYAEHAVKMIRTWFLNPETKMNPNMTFSQAIPGRNDGRGSGILDARGFILVIDAIALLAGSPAWTQADQRGMQEWFSQYYTWLRQSKNGNSEWNAKNNHGTWYDVQAISMALFIGKRQEAKEIAEEAKTRRIGSPIEPDGSQPQELARTTSWHYSVFNLDALFHLASLAERVGVDLWNDTTADGRGIHKALDYLVPYLKKEKEWPHPELKGVDGKDLYSILLQASIKYRDPKYSSLARKIPGIDLRNNRFLLLYGMQ